MSHLHTFSPVCRLFRTPVCQPTGQMCCVGGWQSPTSSLRSRSDPLHSTQLETASARYQYRDTVQVTSYLLWATLTAFTLISLPVKEYSEVPARQRAGLWPTCAGCGPQRDALHWSVHVAPAPRVQHQGVFRFITCSSQPKQYQLLTEMRVAEAEISWPLVSSMDEVTKWLNPTFPISATWLVSFKIGSLCLLNSF